LNKLRDLWRRWFGGGRSSSGLTVQSLCSDLGFEVSPEVMEFRHVPGGKVLFAPGALGQAGKEAARLGGTRVLLVTDPGIRSAGHEDRAIDSLRRAGLEAVVFDRVRENPTTRDVALAVEAAREGAIDLIMGLGGGSSLDTAKGCNFILTNGGEMRNYWGVNKAQRPMLPFIAIPTTAGTGSECQSFALIADEETHQKMACGDKKAAAAVAILDPELTLTKPRGVTACTGIDALAHAVETAVCKKRTEISAQYSRVAFHLLNRGFEAVLREPGDLEARARMLLGAAFAGTAIENSMLGAAHSTANPLTAHYGTIHGVAVGLMLPHVVSRNRQNPEANAMYDRLCPGLEQRLQALLSLAELPGRAGAVGLDAASIPVLAAEAAKQWTAQYNPVALDAEGMADLYQVAL
jgi:alcohol dehydrogenase